MTASRKRLADIRDVLLLSLPRGEASSWLITPSAALGGKTPLACMLEKQFEAVYAAALAL